MKRDDSLLMSEPLSPEAVQNEVSRILASEKFGRSKKLRSLLQFTVDQTLRGNADTLKEYVIGTEVLKKPDTYDPRRDSLVRVMASRLRVKLKEYYTNGGSEDPLVIELPKGKYVPRFQTRESLQTEMEQKVRARNACSHARFLATRLTEEDLAASARHFQEAIEADPHLVAAYSGLANVCALQGFLGLRRPSDVWPAARIAAKSALEMDEMGSEAHMCLGMAEAFFDWRWRAAESRFGKAIEVDPYSGAGRLWRAVASLIPTGQMPAAQEEIAKASQFAPGPFLQELQVLALYFAGQYDAVVNLTEHVTNGEPGSGWVLWMRGLALAALDRLGAAVQVLSGLHQAVPGNPRVLSSLGYVYGLSNQPEQAQQTLAALDQSRQRGVWTSSYDRALIQVGSGKQEEALGLLEAALEEREPWLAFLTVDPRLGALRSEPRFTAIVRRVFLETPAD